jgi:hypothetical protein
MPNQLICMVRKNENKNRNVDMLIFQSRLNKSGIARCDYGTICKYGTLFCFICITFFCN